jgi:hypothetical protein
VDDLGAPETTTSGGGALQATTGGGRALDVTTDSGGVREAVLSRERDEGERNLRGGSEGSGSETLRGGGRGRGRGA